MSQWNLGASYVPNNVPAARNKVHNPFLDPDDTPSEYQQDVWETLLEQESQKPVIHLQSPQLKFRATLVVFIRKVSMKLGLSVGTMHVAVSYMDCFMDTHRLREDRLLLVALACLSLATKTEEKFTQAPAVRALSTASGLPLCPKLFKKMEFMIAVKRKWRMLIPTAVTFASILAKHVVTYRDVISCNLVYDENFKSYAAKLLEKYLDLSISTYHLAAKNSLTVACACIACTRGALGLIMWPTWLAVITDRQWPQLSSSINILQEMMKRKMAKQYKLPQSNMSVGNISATPIPSSVSWTVTDHTHSNTRPFDPSLPSTSQNSISIGNVSATDVPGFVSGSLTSTTDHIYTNTRSFDPSLPSTSQNSISIGNVSATEVPGSISGSLTSTTDHIYTNTRSFDPLLPSTSQNNISIGNVSATEVPGPVCDRVTIATNHSYTNTRSFDPLLPSTSQNNISIGNVSATEVPGPVFDRVTIATNHSYTNTRSFDPLLPSTSQNNISIGNVSATEVTGPVFERVTIATNHSYIRTRLLDPPLASTSNTVKRSTNPPTEADADAKRSRSSAQTQVPATQVTGSKVDSRYSKD